MARLTLAIVLSAFLAAARTPAGDTKKAKAYLAEVKKHLLESYVEREKMKDEKLVETGLQALAAAMDHKDYADLDEDARAAVKKAVQEARSLDEALDAADTALGDRKFDFIKFADHAAIAMVKSTGDPFSRILTAEDFNKLLKLMQGGSRDDSVGLMVQAKDGKVLVGYVQYGYPAYDEGVDIGDEVLTINGKAVAGMKQEDLNELVKVKPGESIELNVKRPGHAREYRFKITQRKIPAKDVRFEYLGEGVGYLRLTIFDLKLSSEVKKGLQSMKDAGMKAIILDLRHNPGGALPAATEVADLFLGQGLVITTTVSSYKPKLGGMEFPGMGGDQEYKTKKKSEFEEMPMVVLINGASASASELLCGALQDHKRGKLIGEKTYGKGVGQSPIFLDSVFQQRYLYLTVMRYNLPSGRSIHHKGVEPDIEYKESKPSPEKFGQIWDLRGKVAQYVNERWGSDREVLRKLADNDRFEFSAYPGFDKFYAPLKTKLAKDDVRAEIRRAIRMKMTVEEGTQWVCDLETDVQLQRALVELLDVLGK